MNNTDNQSAGKVTDTFDKYFRVIASHPYLCVFALCVVLTPLFFGSLWLMPAYTIYIALALSVAALSVFVWKKCVKKGLPVVTRVLLLIASSAALSLGAWAFSRSDFKILWIFLTGCMAISAVYSVFYRSGYKRQFNSALIMALGFLVRFCYVLCTESWNRQHDIGYFSTSETVPGHLGYISYLYQNHSLYQEDYRWMFQYCHPPLHHSIGAVWVTIWKDLFRFGEEKAVESLEMLTLFYSACILISAYYILRHFRLEGKSLYVPLLLVSFHPCFTYLATFLNNDALMWAFVMGAVLGTLRWYSEPSLKNIMKISLCIGLGMMTKLSAALIAPPVAMVFLVVLIRKRKTLWKKLVGQFAAFGAVCVPLGMWFPVRGLLRWGIPLTYVQELPQGMDQELHGMTFIERITDFRLIQFSNVFEDWMYHDEYGNEVSFNEHNPLIAILKNSVFSEFIREWDFDGMEYALPLCKALFWLGVILAAAAFAAMIYIFIRDRSMDTVQKLFFGSYYVLLVGNLYMMSAKYPLVCTMNFRYLMPTVVTGALFIGLFMKKKNNRYTDPAAVVSVTAFSALSALVYLLVGQAS